MPASARSPRSTIAVPPAPDDSSSVFVATIRSPASSTPSACEHLRGEHHRRDPALHVAGAAPVELPVAHLGGERVARPAVARLDRDDVDVPVEDERPAAACAAPPRDELRPCRRSRGPAARAASPASAAASGSQRSISAPVARSRVGEVLLQRRLLPRRVADVAARSCRSRSGRTRARRARRGAARSRRRRGARRRSGPCGDPNAGYGVAVSELPAGTNLLDEARALVDAATERGVVLRLLGGIAVRVLCPDLPARTPQRARTSTSARSRRRGGR